MSLERRARLIRKTPLRRTPFKRSPRRLASHRPNTGPSRATRALVWARAGGCCELCGYDLQGRPSTAYSIHHRLPRRMGGRSVPWINTASNLLLLCGTATTPRSCHLLIESQRASAYGYGWLLREGQSPADVPVVLGAPTWPKRTRMVWLTDAGTYAERPAA